MSRSQAFDAVNQLRSDLLGESKVDPGLLVRMSDRMEAFERRQDRLYRNPLVWLGFNLHYALTVIGVIIAGVSTYFFKDKLGL